MSTESNQSENQPNTTPEVPEVPDLDKIISQITANGEFQDMMNSLSDGLKSVEQLQSDVPSTTDSTIDDNSKNIKTDAVTNVVSEHPSNYDICATFFADEDGNNICESLRGVQKSLDAINENLGKLVTLVYQHKSICPKFSSQSEE